MHVEFVIDGYNLLHHAGLGQTSYSPGEFEQARNRLLKRLQSSLSEEERARTSIVFDAQYAEHVDRRPVLVYGMTVLFSPRGRQADDLIEILLAAHPQPQQVVVVSSDHRLLQAARRARAGAFTSDAFLVELEERRRKQDRQEQQDSAALQKLPATRTAGLDAVEVDRWMEEFGEIDLEAVRREVHEEMRSASPDPKIPERTAPSPPSPASEQTSPASQQGGMPADPDSFESWFQGVVPLDRGPGTFRSKRSPRDPLKHRDPSAGASLDDEGSHDESELNFWRLRIEEMLREEDASGEPPQTETR